MLAITGHGRVSQVLDPWPATPSDDTGHATHDTTSNTPHTTHDTIHCVGGQDLLTLAVLVMCPAHVTGYTSPCPVSRIHLLSHGNLKLDHCLPPMTASLPADDR